MDCAEVCFTRKCRKRKRYGQNEAEKTGYCKDVISILHFSPLCQFLQKQAANELAITRKWAYLNSIFYTKWLSPLVALIARLGIKNINTYHILFEAIIFVIPIPFEAEQCVIRQIPSQFINRILITLKKESRVRSQYS